MMIVINMLDMIKEYNKVNGQLPLSIIYLHIHLKDIDFGDLIYNIKDIKDLPDHVKVVFSITQLMKLFNI